MSAQYNYKDKVCQAKCGMVNTGCAVVAYGMSVCEEAS